MVRSYTMTLPYHYAPDSYRNNSLGPPTLAERFTQGLRHHIGNNVNKRISPWRAATHPKDHNSQRFWNPRRLISIPNGIIILWLALLWWGERLVFQQSISKCDWNIWERWVYSPRASITMYTCGAYEAYAELQYSLEKQLPII